MLGLPCCHSIQFGHCSFTIREWDFAYTPNIGTETFLGKLAYTPEKRCIWLLFSWDGVQPAHYVSLVLSYRLMEAKSHVWQRQGVWTGTDLLRKMRCVGSQCLIFSQYIVRSSQHCMLFLIKNRKLGKVYAESWLDLGHIFDVGGKPHSHVPSLQQ